MKGILPITVYVTFIVAVVLFVVLVLFGMNPDRTEEDEKRLMSLGIAIGSVLAVTFATYGVMRYKKIPLF